MNKLPKVVLVGRTNVGKSTLFNRISVDVKSLTLDYEGVTRDFLSDTVCWQGLCFELIDSGGITLQKLHDTLAQKVQRIVLDLMQEADVVIFVCDGTVGLLPEDREIAKYLHKLGKKVLLVINKIDDARTEEQKHEFIKAGYIDIFPISAQHGRGIHELLEAIVKNLPKKIAEHDEKQNAYRIILLGKPNVGKSSLMNALLNRERSVVTNIPGTTREAIAEPITFYQETIALIDTPGIRRKRAVDEPLEQMMVKSSFRALESASIVLLLIDSAEGSLSDQELKLAFYAFEQGKALILLFNKEDLLGQEQQQDLKMDLKRYAYFVDKIPSLYISCKTGKNIGKILPLVREVWKRHSQWLPEQELNTLCKSALEKTPLYHKTERLILYRAEQVATAPITVVLHVNQALWFAESQRAFFANIIRNHFDLYGASLLIAARTRRPR